MFARHKSIIRWCYRIAVVLTALVLVWVVWLIIDFRAENAIETRLDEYVTQGYPVSIRDLNESVAMPAEVDNQGPYLREAFSYIVRYEGTEEMSPPIVGQGVLPAIGEPFPKETLQAMEAHLAANAEALRILRQALARRQCRYMLDFSGWMTGDANHWAGVRRGCSLLMLQGLLAIEEDDVPSAIGAVSEILRLANSLRDEPIAASLLVRRAAQIAGSATLERVLSRGPIEADQIKQLSTLLRESVDTGAMARAIVGERCFGIAFFRKEKPLIHLPGISADSSFHSKGPFLDNKQFVSYLDIMEELLAASQEAGVTLPSRIQASVEAWQRHLVYHNSMVSRALVAGLPHVIKKDVNAIARIRCAYIALQVEQFRTDNGTLPLDFGEFRSASVEEMLDDPFGSGLLKYKKMTKGYIVYSIGADGIDNGGTNKASDPSFPLDIVFHVLR